MGDTPERMRSIFAISPVARSAVAVFAIAMCAAPPVQAKFAVCNKAANPAKVAIGLFDGKAWVSEGWWTIDPHDCATLIDHPLVARYYYLYATDGGAGSWSGGRSFCVAPRAKFTIRVRSDCVRHGYDKVSFFEVDTGAQPDWTQSLSD